MTETEKFVAAITASFAKAIAPVVARLKVAEEEVRAAGAVNRSLTDRVKALEQQQK